MTTHTKKLLAAVIAAGAITGAAQAQLAIVDWGQSDAYVTTGTALNGWSSTGATFSTSTNRSPSASYSTPTGLSGTFYGGGQVVSTNGSGSFANHVIGNNQTDGSAYDTLRWQATWSGTSGANAQNFVTLVSFNKSDFLNYSGGDVTITGTNTFTLRGTGASSFANSSTARIVVQNGASWFISSDIAGGALNDNAYTTFSGAFSTLTWSNYDPSISMATIGTAATPTFNNVTSIGFQINMGSTGTGSNSQVFQFNDFSITGTPIPEPSSFAALVGLGALGFVASRRRRSA